MPRFKHNKNYKRQRVDSGSTIFFPEVNTGGITPPGFNNLGPLNTLALPTNPDDEHAFFHDPRYLDIQESGQNPYWRSSNADRIFNEAEMVTTPGRIGQYIFGAKNAIAPSIDESIVRTTNVDRAKKWLDRARRNIILSTGEKEPVISDLVKEHAHHQRLKDRHSLHKLFRMGRVHTDDDMRSVNSDTSNARSGNPGGDRGSSSRVVPVNDKVVPATDAPMEKASSGGSSAVAASGARKAPHGETPVDPYNYISRTPFKDTVTVRMPFIQYGTLDNLMDTTNAVALTYRLNSIYDVQSSDQSYAAASSTVAADSADAVVQVPMFRDYYADYYQYWTVVESRYRFHIYANFRDPLPFALSVHTYHHGRDAPPLFSSGTTVIPDFQRRLHPNHRHDMCWVPGPYDTGNTAKYGARVNGGYIPGSIDHGVKEDEFEQTWHRLTEVPPTEEMVTFIIQQSDYYPVLTTNDFRFTMEIEYVVQWKDLQYQHQYLTAASSIPARSNYSSYLATVEAVKKTN